MKNLNKLALGVALAAGIPAAVAGTITNDGATQTVGAEMSQGGELVGNVAQGNILIELGKNYIGDDKLTFTVSNADLSNGQSFRLYTGAADFDDFNFFSATSNTITMRASGPLDAGRVLSLTGEAAGASAAISFDLSPGASGTEVTIAVTSTGPNDAFVAPATFFAYEDQFSAQVSGALDAVVDAENSNRLAFTTGVSDVVALAPSVGMPDITNGLGGLDVLSITLNGDMSGIGGVTLGPFNATITPNSATLEVPAGIFFVDGFDNEIELTANGSDVLSPRVFTMSADLILEDEGTDPLFEDSAAGAFTMNGAQARVAQLSLNYGFIQWIKVANLSDQPATIFGDLVYNGTVLQNIDLGSVGAQSVATVGGNALEAALADAGITAGTDASLTLTVAANPNDVVFHAEKRDGMGRSVSEVLTDATNALR
jgi:hypothetical protein